MSVKEKHSYANTHALRCTHLALDLRVDFSKKELRGLISLISARTITSEATGPKRVVEHALWAESRLITAGSVQLHFKVLENTRKLLLDTKELVIHKVGCPYSL